MGGKALRLRHDNYLMGQAADAHVLAPRRFDPSNPNPELRTIASPEVGVWTPRLRQIQRAGALALEFTEEGKAVMALRQDKAARIAELNALRLANKLVQFELPEPPDEYERAMAELTEVYLPVTQSS